MLLFAFFIGVLTGLRTLTPIAVISWAAHLGRAPLTNPMFAWIGSLPALIIFTVLAAGEWVGDKLPKTPARTALPGLLGRSLFGAVCGATLASAGDGSPIAGAAAGLAGALAGTFGGYHARRSLVAAIGCPDWMVAVAEDLICLGGSVFFVTRF